MWVLRNCLALYDCWKADELLPGESAVAQIFLNEPAVAVWNQPFVMRRQSPVETIGGGRSLAPQLPSNPQTNLG